MENADSLAVDVYRAEAKQIEELRKAFKEAKECKGKPTAIIAKSIKGKGVSFMENLAKWHGNAPKDDEFELAMEELEKAGNDLCQR